jgi:type I restriction enzyme S subunit
MGCNKNLKPGWKVWRFDQMATNVNVRIDNPSESGMEHYVGLEHLDADSLKIRRWGTPDDVEATKLMFKKGDIIFGRRRAYQRKLGVAEFDGICSAHAMVLRAKPEVVLPEFLPFFMQSDLFHEPGGGNLGRLAFANYQLEDDGRSGIRTSLDRHSS